MLPWQTLPVNRDPVVQSLCKTAGADPGAGMVANRTAGLPKELLHGFRPKRLRGPENVSGRPPKLYRLSYICSDWTLRWDPLIREYYVERYYDNHYIAELLRLSE